MAISPLHSLGEGDMAHITQQLSRKQGQVGYINTVFWRLLAYKTLVPAYWPKTPWSVLDQVFRGNMVT